MANASLKAERKRRSKFSRRRVVAYVVNSSVIPRARSTLRAVGTRDRNRSPYLSKKRIGGTRMRPFCANASLLTLRSTGMYLMHHGSLKPDGTDVVIGGPEGLMPSSEYETMSIFVAGNKCSQSFCAFGREKP